VFCSVVCNQLGFGDAIRVYINSHFGSGLPVWLDEVQCTTRDFYLSGCSHNIWGGSDCHHRDNAGVACSGVGMQLKICQIIITTRFCM